MRLFFGIELPPDARAALGRTRPNGTHADDHGYRWVDPALLHVTLAFLGEQPPAALESLRTVGRETAAQWRGGPVELALAGFGAFGPRRAPRALWAGLAGDLAGLAGLQAALAQRLRSLGVRLDDRPFAPHVTLARRRDGPPATTLPWPPAAGPPLAFPAEDFCLFDSQLAPTGPRYTVLDRFPLV